MGNKRALIIGCGIAGPAIAIFLRRAGYEPRIYEAQPDHDDYAGLFLNVARNGMRILSELGVDDRIRREGIEMRVMSFHSSSGKWLGTIGDRSGEVQGFTVKRGFLHKVLREAALQEGIPIEFGKRLANLQMTDRQVTAFFEDGTSAEGDLLVGCDGIHSRTRRLILPNAPEPDYTGLISFGGFARGVDVPREPGTQHMVFGKKAFFGYLVKSDGEIYWFGNLNYPGRPTRKELMSIPQAEWRQVISNLYQGELQPVPDIIRKTESHIGVYPIYDLISVSAWYSGPAVLIGDAIHATSPNAGQGASLALEDALMLAKCVRDIGNLGEAFRHFELLRRERVEKIVKYSRSIGQRKHATNPVQVFFRDLMLPFFLKMASRQSLAWMYDYRVNWHDKVTV
ncbi:FAD-dependent oxidoreductase [Brevibacillus aydinogluensis]|jgi:2-polyprenyl-6-methoxyphenol hydroxylase-like FAD-dependent oxidoreductase|uniref:FAD-dependent oxidoreductase n=1 Tax=Brevibacillus aydinogluensis TaxID=927786 RepID=A0AA48RG35_9BACL|nr:FAD-dependent monooxygenase [Brevibacillus aydinogluensis]CAJ1001233.1 FAD-dependent oxidoreductase [Brevibacillus aydinogluensis]